jgi:hypothetical protein
MGMIMFVKSTLPIYKQKSALSTLATYPFDATSLHTFSLLLCLALA